VKGGATTQTTEPFRLAGDPRRNRRERVIRRVFLTGAALSLLISAAIVVALAGRAWAFLASVDPASLWSLGWFPRRGLYDMVTIVSATLLIAGVAMTVATPLGLGSAVYLSEYARPRARRVLKPILEILAGIPSVVVGFFALTWISPEIIQRFLGGGIFSMAAAGLGVGVLVTPLVASVSEDALRAVPQALRYAGFGLGARRGAIVRRVVVPAALPGIVASLILGISRAIGETMVVFMAAGAVGGALRSFDLLGPGQSMTAAMAALAVGTDQVAGSGLAFESLFFVGLLLFVMTLGLNLASNRMVRRMRNRY